MGTEGDSFFVAFPTATAAVAAAAAAQHELATCRLAGRRQVRVRMGVHTGSPTPHGDGYVGIDVHRAARVAGAAHGGQVVITEATARAGRRRASRGMRTRATSAGTGSRTWPPPSISTSCRPRAPPRSSRPCAASGATSLLPAEVGPLVGRDEAMRELTGLIRGADARLITLTGPGGTGKTRLATAVAPAGRGDLLRRRVLPGALRVVDVEGMVGAIGEAVGLHRRATCAP